MSKLGKHRWYCGGGRSQVEAGGVFCGWAAREGDRARGWGVSFGLEDGSISKVNFSGG